MREGVKAVKERQAKSVNEGRARKVDEKHQAKLKEGEICTLKIDARIKSSIKQLPVIITSVKVARSGNRYSICIKHGHLKETYDRNDLVPRKGHTAGMEGIGEK
jgi:hypothetical protein